MNNNYKESFEQIKIAGALAAGALDEVTSYVKPGVTTNKLDKISNKKKIAKRKMKRFSLKDKENQKQPTN